MEHWIYLLPIAAVGYLLWSRRAASAADVQSLLARGAQIVDVRSRAEYKAAAHPRSINIPLDDLEQGAKKLDPAKPVLVCCASGARSASAVALLKRQGFREVQNLGSWQRIQTLLS